MADPLSKTSTTRATTPAAAASKRADQPNGKPNQPAAKPISRGMLSLLVGSVALSLYSVPYVLVRILAVLVSLGGMGLAVLQFRTDEKSGRNFNGALAGVVFCSAVILLTAIGPYLPTPGPRVARPRRESDIPRTTQSISPRIQRSLKTAQSVSPRRDSTASVARTTAQPESDLPADRHVALQATNVTPQTTGNVSKPATGLSRTTNDAAANTNVVPPTAKNVPPVAESESEPAAGRLEKPNEVPQIPSNIPKVIPFPCRKSFRLVPSESPEWVDAATSALLQGEVAVCVVSAATEQLKVAAGGTTAASKGVNLVIHLQVDLVGTAKTIDFAGWGSANYGDSQQRPVLKDDSNHVYELRQLEPGTKVADHERSKSLYPQLYADDYLIYEPPPDKIESLRLELPASAFGGLGTLHFQIPKSMIESK